LKVPGKVLLPAYHGESYQYLFPKVPLPHLKTILRQLLSIDLWREQLSFTGNARVTMFYPSVDDAVVTMGGGLGAMQQIEQ
jgi:hypothetical protein